MLGKVASNKDKEGGNKFKEVICFPLFGVLRAMNVTKVDYFSLDVEGNEMDILRTIPFDDVDITVRGNSHVTSELSWYGGLKITKFCGFSVQ